MHDRYAQIFAQRSLAYHEACVRWPQARRAEFLAAIEPLHLRSGDVCLDAPSGGGYLGDFLPAGVTHVALDPTPNFAEFSRRRPQCHAVNASLHATGQAASSVDAIVSVAGLHHAADRDAIYAEWARLARPGARLSLLDVGADTDEARFLNIAVHSLNPEGHIGDFIGPTESARLEAAGWVVDSCARVEYSWDFASRESMGDYVRVLFGMTRARESATAVSALETYCRHWRTEHGWSLRWGLLRLVAHMPAIGHFLLS